jgi:hypothetical protein
MGMGRPSAQHSSAYCHLSASEIAVKNEAHRHEVLKGKPGSAARGTRSKCIFIGCKVYRCVSFLIVLVKPHAVPIALVDAI